ncbi:uncharacterized protein [Littorina saxatilis]|uniref:Uncharacterized protein n=1 Tax=Littorina saxatilis TaxID=31220 RepID=A0AAN9BRZ4_9CAEN
MGETQPQEPEVLISFAEGTEQTTSCPKERRNGKWNIFEGIDTAVQEKLGLSQEIVRHLVAGADDTVSERLSQLATHLTRESADDSCKCERARIYRSFSASVGEEMQSALQNGHRRNAVGNLFDILAPAQKLMLVERIQEQLDGLNCLCDASSNCSSTNSNSDVLLSLSDFTSPISSPTSSAATSPRTPNEIISCP